MAWALPLYVIRFPRWLGAMQIDLNPGPFNIKEHTVITMMANISFIWMTGLHVATAAQVWLEEPFSDRYAYEALFHNSAQTDCLYLASLSCSRCQHKWEASALRAFLEEFSYGPHP